MSPQIRDCTVSFHSETRLTTIIVTAASLERVRVKLQSSRVTGFLSDLRYCTETLTTVCLSKKRNQYAKQSYQPELKVQKRY